MQKVCAYFGLRPNGARAFVLMLPLLAACGDDSLERPKTVAGEPQETKSTMMEAGAKLIQNKPPLEAISTYLHGFHFYNGNMQGQMQAHHYVTMLNDEFMQAVIYDSNKPDAKLIGIEYIISERLFNNLPPEEKILWHSHHYEVKSGALAAPGLPDAAENELMRKIVSTYGKTWHTWHSDLHPQLPTGIPALMMSFTGDGQLNPELIRQRDQQLQVDTQELARRRENIPVPQVDPMANAWEKDGAMQLILTKVATIIVPPPQTDAPEATGEPVTPPEPELSPSESTLPERSAPPPDTRE